MLHFSSFLYHCSAKIVPCVWRPINPNSLQIPPFLFLLSCIIMMPVGLFVFFNWILASKHSLLYIFVLIWPSSWWEGDFPFPFLSNPDTLKILGFPLVENDDLKILNYVFNPICHDARYMYKYMYLLMHHKRSSYFICTQGRRGRKYCWFISIR